MSDSPAHRSGAPRARSLEGALLWLVIGGGLPGVVVSLVLLWRSDLTPELRWTLALAVVLVWMAAAASSE